RVEKTTSSSWGLTKRNKTKAAARVACPQRFSSQAGENQRNAYPVGEGTRNVVAGRLFSVATLRRRASSNQKSKKQTAAGLPRKARSVNASTWNRGMCILLDSTRRRLML